MNTKFLIGKKVRQTRMFDSKGQSLGVTIVTAGPCWVTQVKTKDHDGVDAIQLGFLAAKKSKQAQIGHSKSIMKETGFDPKTPSFRYFREFRVDNPKEFTVGMKLTVEDFQKGDRVNVVGRSKGKGFQGVVRRHGFSGSPATHGHKDQLRMPGSIGSGFPEKVFKGKRMAGRMGGDRVTVKGLFIVNIEKEKNELWITGAVPGSRQSLLTFTTVQKI